jgi:hypothetical protein
MQSMENLTATATQLRVGTELTGQGRSPEAIARVFFWAVAVIFGFLQAWSVRTTMLNDTISYLDMGDYIVHGHLAMVVNGIWSPLYPCILGFFLAILRPSIYWQYPAVHLLLFAIFLVTLRCFEFLLRELMQLRQSRDSDGELHVPNWVWMVFGYTLFLWASLDLIHASETAPDMIVAAFFYLACGLLVRIRAGHTGWKQYLLLGLVLGLGYLTKSIMFPVAVVCFGVAWLLGRHQLALGKRLAAAIAVFLLIGGPYIVALSRTEHRLSFGETGTYNYAVHVNKIAAHYWMGETPGNGAPVHPVLEAVSRPPTFEFGNAVGGTYPIWYDPGYWYMGVKDRFHLRQEAMTIKTDLESEGMLLFALSGSLVGGIFLLFYVSPYKIKMLQELGSFWFLYLPALCAPVLYLLVWYEPRYVAPFVVVLGLCLFFSCRLPDTNECRKLISGVVILTLIMLLSPFSMDKFPAKFSSFGDLLHSPKQDVNSSAAVASGMLAMGLHPGDRISSLEFSNLGAAMWAHLARVRIVAEVYYWPGKPEMSANDFWNADFFTQQKVMQAFTAAGARAVVSDETPRGPGATGWVRVGETNYYLHWL